MGLTVAAIQMPVCESKQVNLETMREYVARAANTGAQAILLPEMFCCLYSNDSFIANCEPVGGPAWQSLSLTAEQNGVWLIGGSVPERDEAGHIYNTSFVFNPNGKQVGYHRKMHLFDIDVKGGQYFKESDVFTAGNKFTIIDTAFGKIGVIICFDIRFPELSRILALKGAQIIFVPGAFNMTTGPAHWETHFRSRAIDNQVFMMGCAPARAAFGYQSYGHSILVNPWGTILQQLEFEPGILLEKIDLNEVNSIREQLPLMSARRTDKYVLEEIE